MKSMNVPLIIGAGLAGYWMGRWGFKPAAERRSLNSMSSKKKPAPQERLVEREMLVYSEYTGGYSGEYTAEYTAEYDDKVDEASRESFPASDPPGW